jgi:hypothetical protein
VYSSKFLFQREAKFEFAYISEKPFLDNLIIGNIVIEGTTAGRKSYVI